ncbi:MAG: hypothetical protein ACE14W_10710 [Candidatus Velamenicoccus archaeovorus]
MNVLTLKRPALAAERLDEIAGDLIPELDDLVPRALRGSAAAAAGYVRAWRALAERLLELAHREHPRSVVMSEAGFMLADVTDSPTAVAARLLDHLALQAPFSPWVARYGPGRGVAVFLLDEVRRLVPGLEPMSHRGTALPHWDLSPDGFARFSHNVWVEVAQRTPPLARIQAVLRLSDTELARLFGVRRQAAAQWLDEGLPPARLPKALAVLQVVDLLERNLQPDRIPAVARTPAPAYDGRTMLEMIERDRHVELLELTRASFDWAVTA